MQAKRANDLSIHVHRIAIYEEVVSFSDCFRGLFTVPSEARLEQFRKKAAHRAEIYLNDDIYRQLLEIYTHCYESQVWLHIAEEDANKSPSVPHELQIRSEYKSVLNLLVPTIELIKSEIKLDDS